MNIEEIHWQSETRDEMKFMPGTQTGCSEYIQHPGLQ